MRRMGMTVLLGALLTLMAGAALANGAVVWFRYLNDVPVMPGLTEIPADAVLFDQPQGRIIESLATGRGFSPKGVEDWYRSALPQLGWTPESGGRYAREDERLTLRAESRRNGEVAVRLTLTPE